MHNSEKSTEVCSPFNDLCDSSVLPQPVTFSVSVLEVEDIDLKAVVKTEVADGSYPMDPKNAAENSTLCNIKSEFEDNANIIIPKSEDGSAADPLCPEWATLPWKYHGNIIDSYRTVSSRVSKDKGLPKPHKEIPVFHSSSLRCPLCDKTFKGGKVRLPCLIQHISKRHYRKSCRLLGNIAGLSSNMSLFG